IQSFGIEFLGRRTGNVRIAGLELPSCPKANGPFTFRETKTMSSNPSFTITLDKTDYAPDETAAITATNLPVGGTLTFNVDHVLAGTDGILGTADDTLAQDLSGTGTSWAITDGGPGDLDGVANGTIMTSWVVGQDALNQAFLLSATDTA